MNLLGSHDLARFLHFAGGDKSSLRLATLFQMTFPGAPSIYYGDEVGMEGGHDPDNRRAFPWDRPDLRDADLLHDFQRMIALRKRRPALRRGSFAFLQAEGDVASFLRKLGDESVVVLFNTGRHATRIDIPIGDHLSEGSVLAEEWSRGEARVEGGKLRSVELPPRSARVFATPATAS